ncbi:MAG: hypothetical protein ABJO09_11515 [Hyphomicrobiales bacterium]
MTHKANDLVQQFENETLDPKIFGHTEHLMVAYAMLRKYTFIKAAASYAKSIQALAERAGAPSKFNTTITLAFLSTIAERMSASNSLDWDDFISQNQDLCSKNILTPLYSMERLNSDLARHILLLPDFPQRRHKV